MPSPDDSDLPPLDHPPERGRHDKEGRQRALLDAATRVFARYGFDAATTREVAEIARCSEGLIHRYFGGKRGLLLALLEARAPEIAATISRPSSFEGSVAAQIADLLISQIDAMWENREIMRVNVSQASIDAEVGDVIARQYNDVRIVSIESHLSGLQLAGRIRPDVNIHSVAHALSGLGFAMGFWAQVVFAQPRDEIHHSARAFADILARGLEPSPCHTSAGEDTL